MDAILILVGPSAVGKTTVMTKILELYSSEFESVRSATTRAPRGDAFDGEYIYLSREDFLLSVERGDLLEYMEYGGNLYGTPKSEIIRILSEGKTPLLVLDMVGVESIKSKEYPFLTVAAYIYDTLDVLTERLSLRYLSDKNDRVNFDKRIRANIADYLSLPERETLFDIFIRNEGVLSTAEKIVTDFYKYRSGKSDRPDFKNIASALRNEAQKEK